MNELSPRFKYSFFSCIIFVIIFLFLQFPIQVLAAVPTTGAIFPTAGFHPPNTPRVFTCTYLDSDGWQNIKETYLLINTIQTKFTNTVYIYYDQNLNKLYLRNDANTAWLGGYAPGTANTIENSQVKLHCSSSRVVGTITKITVYYSVTFKDQYSGKAYNVYVRVKDDTGGISSWTKKGTYTVNNPPNIGSITPSESVSESEISDTWTTTCTDTDGWQNIQYEYLLINTSTNLTNSVYVQYSQNTNKLYLRDNANTAWLGGYEPGTSNIIENSQAKIDCSKIIVSGTGQSLNITWDIMFKPAFKGTKNVYESIKDDAGAIVNFREIGTIIINESGALIGPEGGEVISNDGKVKIIIPSGALSESKWIKALAVDKDTLIGAAPSGKNVLNVVECRPYGLVFSKPVSLIYTLLEAEIPGTVLELGLYDSGQGKIVSTGENSQVSSDGYSLEFSLMHFSTYAALKSTDQQAAPINASVKIPLPDMLTGAFGHSIPITVSPGRKGVQPGIGLRYSSSNSNSWVGVGFSLNSGYIVRSTRLGPPKYTDEDTFYFIIDSGTVELVRLVDNLYQAKIESSFAKFYKEAGDTWRVLNKDGTVLLFGTTTDSKEISTQGTYSWYLTKVQDTNDNYVEYQYTKDEGKSYLYRINYTGNTNGITPKNSVEFILEPREDISSSYISSARIAISKRLKEIQIKVNTELVWKYTLGYEYSIDTNRSLLRSIKQYGSDNKTMPEQTLGYQRAN